MNVALIAIFELPGGAAALEEILNIWKAPESVRTPLEGARYVVLAVDESEPLKLSRAETERDVITECTNLRTVINQAGVGCKFMGFVSPEFRMRLVDALGVPAGADEVEWQ